MSNKPNGVFMVLNQRWHISYKVHVYINSSCARATHTTQDTKLVITVPADGLAPDGAKQAICSHCGGHKVKHDFVKVFCLSWFPINFRWSGDMNKKIVRKISCNITALQLTHWSLEMTFSDAFSSKKICVGWPKLQWIMFLSIQLINRHWFR